MDATCFLPDVDAKVLRRFLSRTTLVRKIEHRNEAFLLVFLWIYVRIGVALHIEHNFSA